MARSPSTATQLLLHRWFVQYNPIYLVSAMLVLGGMMATSRGLAHERSLYGPLGVALIAEVYALSLIGGAALLTRIGQRRPAVMLALVTILYQADLTLHTETCSLLGAVGAVASAAWLGLFVIKLYALVWALRLRLRGRAVATAAFGASGLAVAPWLFGDLNAGQAGAALALFVFVLGSLFVPTAEQAVTSLIALDDWSQRVIRRAVRATWILWGLLLALHVMFWASEHPVDLRLLVPALALVATRRLRSESHVWVSVTAVLALTFIALPSAFSLCALLAALALIQRAFSGVPAGGSRDDAAAPPESPTPYRAGGAVEMRREARVLPRLPVPLESSVRTRLLSGALFGFYLSAWTFGYGGGPFPAHVLALDVALVVAALVMIWRLGARLVLVPVTIGVTHGLFASGLVPLPRSLLEWGAGAVAFGFLLLAVSLATSYRLRHVGPGDSREPLERIPTGELRGKHRR